MSRLLEKEYYNPPAHRKHIRIAFISIGWSHVTVAHITFTQYFLINHIENKSISLTC